MCVSLKQTKLVITFSKGFGESAYPRARNAPFSRTEYINCNAFHFEASENESVCVNETFISFRFLCSRYIFNFDSDSF